MRSHWYASPPAEASVARDCAMRSSSRHAHCCAGFSAMSPPFSAELAVLLASSTVGRASLSVDGKKNTSHTTATITATTVQISLQIDIGCFRCNIYVTHQVDVGPHGANEDKRSWLGRQLISGAQAPELMSVSQAKMLNTRMVVSTGPHGSLANRPSSLRSAPVRGVLVVLSSLRPIQSVASLMPRAKSDLFASTWKCPQPVSPVECKNARQRGGRREARPKSAAPLRLWALRYRGGARWRIP